MKKYLLLFACIISVTAYAQDSTYKELLGKYKFAAGNPIEEAVVTWDNGIITMSSSAGTSTLEKVQGDTFNIVSFSGIAVFKRNDAKKVTGVHVDASGYVMDGVKEGAGFAIAEQENVLNEAQLNTIREYLADIRQNHYRLHVMGSLIP